MNIAETLRSLVYDGANTVEDCLEKLEQDGFMDTYHFLRDIINGGACITRTDEDGDVENYCFYIDEDGNLVSDHDCRCLNSDGERYMCDEWEHEPCTLEEIISIWSIGNGDEWHKGWNNVDCDL